MIHAKTLVVDGRWSVFGSTNLDHRSFSINDEVNVASNSRNWQRAFMKTSSRTSPPAKRFLTKNGSAVRSSNDFPKDSDGCLNANSETQNRHLQRT